MDARWKDRRGWFKVQSPFITDDTDDIARILSQLEFVPTEVTHHWATGDFHYEGYSPMFDVVPRAGITPLYQIIIHRDTPLDYRAEVEKKGDQPTEEKPRRRIRL